MAIMMEEDERLKERKKLPCSWLCLRLRVSGGRFGWASKGNKKKKGKKVERN